MPANLTQQYRNAERRYRQAVTSDDQLRCLQDMLRELPKHKGTDRLQAELKQKISKAKKEAELARVKPKAFRIRIPDQGAGRVVLIGAPNSGKSSLLARLTRATPEVAAYPFTTREPIVGMMPWEDVLVQIVDTPPITPDYLETYMQGLIRGADLIVFAVDMSTDDGVEQSQQVVRRLTDTKTRMGTESLLDESDIGLSYTKTLLALNKADLAGFPERMKRFRERFSLSLDEHVVSTAMGEGIEELRSAIYVALDVVRVYTKSPQEKEPRLENPFTIRRGETLQQVATQVHEDFAKHLRFARVWGINVHPGTQVKGDYIPSDRDVIELHT